MNKLFLINDDLMGFFPKDKNKYNIFEIYKGRSLFFKILGKLYKNTLHQYNPKWVEKLNDIDTVIIFDNNDVNHIANNIIRRFPKKKIIVWYWNPVSKCLIKPGSISNNVSEIWTYDPYDSRRYHMKLNSQFYFAENVSSYKKLSIKKDVFFVGADKNRKQKLGKLEEKLKSEDISYYFHLTSFWASKNKDDTKYQPPMDYSRTILNILNCKAILDLKNSPNQEGISLRPLEALFFKKKLITDNISIINSNLYNPNNIFILGQDDIMHLKEFINNDFIVENNYADICNYYLFENWAKRFS